MSNKKLTENELIETIKELLKKSGHLNKLQAEMRAKVSEALKSRHETKAKNTIAPPQPAEEVLLINELVREYLEWNGYLYTASVMISEAALSEDKKSRQSLCAEVGVKDDEKSLSLPLLVNIVAAYTERIKRKMNKSAHKKEEHSGLALK